MLPLSANLITGRPVLAAFEVTLRCNSACAYCDLPLNQGRYEMSRAEIAHVFRALHRDGLRYVFVQGGEPLLRHDLPEILEDLAGIGFSLSLITNGTRLRPSLVQRLSTLPLSIAVSLDSLDRARYRRIRGADQLPLVLRGIDCLGSVHMAKSIVCIVSEINRDEVLANARFAQQRGFTPVFGAYHDGVGDYGKRDAGLRTGRTAALDTFRLLLEQEVAPRGLLRDFLRDNVDWLAGKTLPRCDAGRYSIVIDASGNVSPCLAHRGRDNLRSLPLSEILRRFDQQHIRACSNASSCNLLCSRVVGNAVRRPLSALRTLLASQAKAMT